MRAIGFKFGPFYFPTEVTTFLSSLKIASLLDQGRGRAFAGDLFSGLLLLLGSLRVRRSFQEFLERVKTMNQTNLSWIDRAPWTGLAVYNSFIWWLLATDPINWYLDLWRLRIGYQLGARWALGKLQRNQVRRRASIPVLAAFFQPCVLALEGVVHERYAIF